MVMISVTSFCKTIALPENVFFSHDISTAKNVTPAKNKNVWTITSNLSTKEVDNLLEDEEEIREEVERLEHNIGINQSAGQ